MWKFNSTSRQPEKFHGEGNEASSTLEEKPTCFDTTDFGKFLDVSKNKLSVKYTGNGLHDNDVGSIQGNHSVPRKQLVYYYEMKILNAGERGLIAIGFAEKGFKMGRHPGWELYSYGYHGDDGRKLTGVVTPSRNSWEEYGPTYSAGDTVGAGIYLECQKMFFTKNGKFLGIAFRNVLKVPLFPTIGLHSRGEQVDVNFGQEAFAFDLYGLIQDELLQQEEAVQSVEAPSGLSHQIVREYLLFFGYARTLHSFVDSAGLSTPNESTSPSIMQQATEGTLELRRVLRERFMAGKVNEAFSILDGSAFRGILGSEGEGDFTLEVYFFIKCLAFIELIRNRDVEEAVGFARRVLAPVIGVLSPAYDVMLEDIAALLAYIDPETSPQKILLDNSQRESVADMVNFAIIEASILKSDSSAPPQAVLEKLLAQLVAVQEELHIANGGHGQVFRLADHLLQLNPRAASMTNGSSANGHGQQANGASNGVAPME